MFTLIVSAISVLGLSWLCIGQAFSDCLCEYNMNYSTLFVECNKFEREEVRECFLLHTQTKHLVFRKSFLERIPDELYLLKHLMTVDFSGNQIRQLELPESTCHSLREVNVDFNKIKELKKGSLDCFTSLTTLRITNNNLEVIEPGAFNKKLKNFQYLQAQYNELKSLDSSLISMVDYNVSVHVNVSFNKIANVTNKANLTLADFNINKTFGISAIHNNITSIDFAYLRHIFNITNILELYNLWNCGIDIRFNPLICDCAMYEVGLLFRIFRHMDPNNPVFSIACYNPPILRGMKLYEVPKQDFNCTIVKGCPSGCSCINTIGLSLVTVNCGQSYVADRLPEHLPFSEKIHLNIKNSELSEIERRAYLKNVSILDVSGNKVKVINPDTVPQMDMMQLVDLSENHLEHLPHEMKEINFTRLTVLKLEGNPFKCDCHSLWLKRWLQKEKDHIPNQDNILCQTGTPIIDTDDSEFVCSNDSNQISMILISIVASASGLGIISLGIYMNRTRIQVCLIAKCHIHCCRKTVSTDLKYDIFLSHSSHDDDIVYREIIPELENHDPPFKICRDDRDFNIGQTIAYNIISSIESSLTTLLIISNNFLRSEWCKMEFKQAHMKLLKEKTSNLIMIILETPDRDLMDRELQCYVNTHVYLKKDDKYFWPKLFQSLPVRKHTVQSLSSDPTSMSSSSTPYSSTQKISSNVTSSSMTVDSAVASSTTGKRLNISNTQTDSSVNFLSESTPLLKEMNGQPCVKVF